MENQPQNLDFTNFRNNPENSPMYLSICLCMAFHINMASTDPFFIFRSSTRVITSGPISNHEFQGSSLVAF